MNDSIHPAPDFEPARLKQFLDARFGNGEIELERIAGGQSNPTYYLDHHGRRMVLRKQPPGPILKGAHAVDREFRVLSALAGTGVPVPRPVIFHAEPDIVGTPFYLMERLEGRVFHNAVLPDIGPEERRAIYLAMAGALARLHAVHPDDAGLGDFGRPGNYFERQIARWSKQWEESKTKDIPAIDHLAEWLTRNLPPDDGQVAIAHGDFRLGNLLFHPTEPRVLGILDWELSTLGHPLADVGFCSMAWHTTPEEYGGIRGLDLTGLGIPSQAEFVARYCAEAPPTAPLQPFHIVFSLFRFAVIFVGIADRVRAGTAVAENAAQLAPLAARFAERGLELTGIVDQT
jgi:aminoglycoside phosphotransferase (APT) family kinase protein